MILRSLSPRSATFIIIGAVLVLALKFFMSESRPPLPIVPPIEVAEKIIEHTAHEGIFNILEDNPDYKTLPEPFVVSSIPQPDFIPNGDNDISIAIEEQTTYIEEFAFTPPAPIKGKGKPKIIIIIDDLGLSYERSKAVSDLQGPLTLAFLPYAEALKQTTDYAQKKGHELLIHVPMQPLNKALDPGPSALLTSLTPDAFDKQLEDIFASFDGYVGINNHMGSRLTQDRPAMTRIMRALKERGLLFVDSKTIGSSVAAATARDHFVPYAERNVFLDHHPELAAVRQSLKLTEKIARSNGFAIAIGHPKNNTIKALREWLPTLKKKGFELAPVSAVVTMPSSTIKDTISTRLVAHDVHLQVHPAHDFHGHEEMIKIIAKDRLRAAQ